MTRLSFKINEIEGPLDLILTLLSKHKLSILDIDIALLLEQYLEALSQFDQADLEMASEFLEMASRLVHMKTVSLLPRTEEAEELKRELEGQLLEYSLCKAAAGHLSSFWAPFDWFVRSPIKLPSEKREYKNIHNPAELSAAFEAACGKKARRMPPPADSFSGIVSKKIVSVISRTVFVLKSLIKKGNMKFASLFSESKSSSEKIATFLAVLELLKAGRIDLDGRDRLSLKKHSSDRRK